MMVKFTHQMAFVEYNDTAHGLISIVWLEVRPSTALLASYSSCGYSWYAGLLRATLTMNIHTSNTYIALIITYLRCYN